MHRNTPHPPPPHPEKRLCCKGEGYFSLIVDALDALMIQENEILSKKDRRSKLMKQPKAGSEGSEEFAEQGETAVQNQTSFHPTKG